MARLSFHFNRTATPEIYTLSLHDALPICPPSEESDAAPRGSGPNYGKVTPEGRRFWDPKTMYSCNKPPWGEDRKSTRLNSSHVEISYAVSCLKKKTSTPSSRMPLAHHPPN